ncbi:class I adenylate-forming enzyme family protein [Ramlibacter albus]|uniref:AMP-binding protein n=1 Tax=Ramlibacter albus TaxID=2079448 RepID=A0A923M7F7_9BURK|nr:AMP-binding protein [Ramlibacter albus]MBC5763952.1 AMP-binding protein [Ramlibacter albus]
MGVPVFAGEVSLAEVVARHALESPGQTALLFEGERLSYGDLARRIVAATRLLAQDWHVRSGDRVAWLGASHPGELVLLFALARLGAVLVPLNYRLAPGEWDRLLADCKPVCVVHDITWAEAAKALAQRNSLASHCVDELMAAPPASDAPTDGKADSPVLLVSTSGTTGGPKLAVHTQANLLANMAIAAASQELSPHDRVLTVLPLFHVGGLCIQTLPALYAGAEVVLHAKFDPGETLGAIAGLRPTLTLQVPATMKALVEHPRWASTDLSSLRAVWAGSSLIPTALVEAFHARGVPLCNVYGATETGPFSIALGPTHARTHVGSCGWPAQGVEAKLGEGGEVLLRAPNIVARYWPDVPALDADGWFATGDLAVQAADGSYTIVGRAKELIISGGENIHPAEIELVLAQHPAVAECAAFGVPDERWGEAVAVAIVAKVPCTEGALRLHLEGQLARFKIPRKWYFVDALPKTALGKVQRAALARRFA